MIRPDEKNLKVHVVESFGENLLSIPQLYDRNIATIFHPTFGIMIADANTMSVTCNQPLGVGRYIDGAFLMDLNLGPRQSVAKSTRGAVATSAEAARYGQQLGLPMDIAPIVPLTTKAILWYKCLGYPSSQRIVDAIYHNI